MKILTTRKKIIIQLAGIGIAITVGLILYYF
jgi:hypothetical protein